MINVDLCVVGSGPAAYFATYAYLNKYPEAKVLVLEAGGRNSDYVPDTLGLHSTGQDFKLSPSHNIGYGGTSQLWHNILTPLDEDDFVTKSWIPNSGWPIEYSDVAPFYDKILDYFGIQNYFSDLSEMEESVHQEIPAVAYDSSVFQPKFFLHPKQYFRANQHFDTLLQNKQIEIKFDSPALAFTTDETQSADVLIFGNNQTGCKSKVQAKHFILAAGAINTPKILLNSEKYKDLSWLGKNLLDHPMGNYMQFVYPEKRDTSLYQDLKVNNDLSIRAGLRLTPEYQQSHQLANHLVHLRPSFHIGAEDKTEKIKLKLLTLRDKLKKKKLPLQEIVGLLTNPNLAKQVLQYKLGMFSAHKIVDCLFISEQTPNESSYIALNNKKNKFGYYDVKVYWQISDSDIKNIASFSDVVAKSLVAPSGGELSYQLSSEQWLTRFNSAAHHLGTVRMGNSIHDGCVDANQKLFNSHNIYVADGSVFPTAGNANSTLSIMALAYRLGDSL